jgi:hypothetical protein
LIEDGGSGEKSKANCRLLFHKQRQSGGVAVQKIFAAKRADFTVGEKSSDAQRPELFLHEAGIMAGPAEEVFAAAVATEQATA